MNLLSICVPSYNDARMLEKTLTNLLPICQHEEIEIVASDNNSADSSQDVLEKFKEVSGGRMQVHIQKENLGFRGNLHFLAEVSSSEYVWFLGIGECIQLGQLDFVLNALREVRPTNIVVSGLVAEVLPEKTSEVHLVASKENGLTPIFSETISLNILKRDLARVSLQKTLSASGDYWPHIEAILESREIEGKNANSVFISTPIVSIAPNLEGWWFDREKSYELSLAQITILSAALDRPGHTVWLKQRLHKMRYIGLGEIVLRSRKNGHSFSKSQKESMEIQAKLNFLQKLLLGLALKTPLSVFAILSRLRTIVNL